MVKIERWEEETDEDWAERLAEETVIANDTETTKYFVEDDPYNEDSFVVNYVGKDSMIWKEHPEGPFKCKQVVEWKKKALKLEAVKGDLVEWSRSHDPPEQQDQLHLWCSLNRIIGDHFGTDWMPHIRSSTMQRLAALRLSLLRRIISSNPTLTPEERERLESIQEAIREGDEEALKQIELKKESAESYLAFCHGQMIPLRHDDTIEQLYSELVKV